MLKLAFTQGKKDKFNKSLCNENKSKNYDHLTASFFDNMREQRDLKLNKMFHPQMGHHGQHKSRLLITYTQ